MRTLSWFNRCLKEFVESASLTAQGKLFQFLTTDGRKKLEYWVVREYIVRRLFSFLKLYREIFWTKGGTSDVKYCEETLLTVL